MSAFPERAEKKDDTLRVGRPLGLIVAAGALCELLARSVRLRVDPNVHVSGAVGVEGDPAAVGGPSPSAVLTRRRDDFLRRANGKTGLGRDGQLPEVRVLPEDREGELRAILRDGNLDVLPRARRQLLRGAGRCPVGVHRDTPDV